MVADSLFKAQEEPCAGEVQLVSSEIQRILYLPKYIGSNGKMKR